MSAHPTVALGLVLAIAASALGTCSHRSLAQSSPAAEVFGGPGHGAGEGLAASPARVVPLAFAERWPVKDQSRLSSTVLPPHEPLAELACPQCNCDVGVAVAIAAGLMACIGLALTIIIGGGKHAEGDGGTA